QRDAAAYDSNSYYRENAGVGLNRKMPLESREEIFSSPGITKTGNISRGISFGNTQNVFVNSTLNLQMEGQLTQDIRLTAVISDQNIPFQPEGNTQQLQQFDKVYVQLETKKARLTVGDIVMKNKPSNYLRYSRNVQGAQLSTILIPLILLFILLHHLVLLLPKESLILCFLPRDNRIPLPREFRDLIN